MRYLLFLFAFIYTQQAIAQKALECEFSLLDISIETDGDSVSINDYNDYTITITYQNTGHKSCELYPGNTASFTGKRTTTSLPTSIFLKLQTETPWHMSVQ